MAEPAPVRELAEHDEIPPVDGHHLPVAPAQRPLGPPAVLDEPRLADRDDLVAVDGLRAPAGPRDDVGGLRDGEPASPRAHSSNGVSTARRSGTRESGSTASTRSAPSGPATARTWRIASRNRARRAAVPSSNSARPRACGGRVLCGGRNRAPGGAGGGRKPPGPGPRPWAGGGSSAKRGGSRSRI